MKCLRLLSFLRTTKNHHNDLLTSTESQKLLFLFIARVTAERPADWPWNEPFGPLVFGLFKQDA